MQDLILTMIVRLILPFIQIYGIYIIVHGHLSPGGGFPGGAILGASMILFALAFNLKEGSSKISHDTSTLLESGGALSFATLGILGVLVGTNYLSNKAAGYPLGTAGNLFSSGMIFLVTLAIGVKVASTFITLFFNLVEGKTHD
jgi:multicomponent Na+:H+ antiporter subunit B